MNNWEKFKAERLKESPKLRREVHLARLDLWTAINAHRIMKEKGLDESVRGQRKKNRKAVRRTLSGAASLRDLAITADVLGCDVRDLLAPVEES